MLLEAEAVRFCVQFYMENEGTLRMSFFKKNRSISAPYSTCNLCFSYSLYFSRVGRRRFSLGLILDRLDGLIRFHFCGRRNHALWVFDALDGMRGRWLQNLCPCIFIEAGVCLVFPCVFSTYGVNNIMNGCVVHRSQPLRGMPFLSHEEKTCTSFSK